MDSKDNIGPSRPPLVQQSSPPAYASGLSLYPGMYSQPMANTAGALSSALGNHDGPASQTNSQFPTLSIPAQPFTFGRATSSLSNTSSQSPLGLSSPAAITSMFQGAGLPSLALGTTYQATAQPGDETTQLRSRCRTLEFTIKQHELREMRDKVELEMLKNQNEETVQQLLLERQQLHELLKASAGAAPSTAVAERETQLMQQVQALQAEVQALQAQLQAAAAGSSGSAAMQAAVQELEGKNRELQQQCSMLTEEKAAISSRVTELEGQLASAAAAVSAAAQEVALLKATGEAAAAAAKVAADEMASLKAAGEASLKAAGEAAASAQAAAEKELLLLRAEVAKLSDQLEQKQEAPAQPAQDPAALLDVAGRAATSLLTAAQKLHSKLLTPQSPAEKVPVDADAAAVKREGSAAVRTADPSCVTMTEACDESGAAPANACNAAAQQLQAAVDSAVTVLCELESWGGTMQQQLQLAQAKLAAIRAVPGPAPPPGPPPAPALAKAWSTGYGSQPAARRSNADAPGTPVPPPVPPPGAPPTPAASTVPSPAAYQPTGHDSKSGSSSPELITIHSGLGSGGDVAPPGEEEEHELSNLETLRKELEQKRIEVRQLNASLSKAQSELAAAAGSAAGSSALQAKETELAVAHAAIAARDAQLQQHIQYQQQYQQYHHYQATGYPQGNAYDWVGHYQRENAALQQQVASFKRSAEDASASALDLQSRLNAAATEKVRLSAEHNEATKQLKQQMTALKLENQNLVKALNRTKEEGAPANGKQAHKDASLAGGPLSGRQDTGTASQIGPQTQPEAAASSLQQEGAARTAEGTDELQAALRVADSRVVELKRQLSAIDEKHIKQVEAVDAQLVKVQEQLSSRLKELENTARQLREAKAELEHMTTRATQLQERFDAAEKERTKLQDELSSLKLHFKAAKSCHAEEQAESAKKLKEAEKKLQDLKQQCADAAAQALQREVDLGKKAEELEGAGKKRCNLERKVEALTAEVAQLQQQAMDSALDKARLKEAAEKLRRELDESLTRKEEYKKDVRQLKSDSETLLRRARHAEADAKDVKDVRQRLREAEQERDNLRRILESSEGKDDLRRKLAEAQSAREKLAAQLEHLQKECKGLRRECASLESRPSDGRGEPRTPVPREEPPARSLMAELALLKACITPQAGNEMQGRLTALLAAVDQVANSQGHEGAAAQQSLLHEASVRIRRSLKAGIAGVSVDDVARSLMHPALLQQSPSPTPAVQVAGVQVGGPSMMLMMGPSGTAMLVPTTPQHPQPQMPQQIAPQLQPQVSLQHQSSLLRGTASRPWQELLVNARAARAEVTRYMRISTPCQCHACGLEMADPLLWLLHHLMFEHFTQLENLHVKLLESTFTGRPHELTKEIQELSSPLATHNAMSFDCVFCHTTERNGTAFLQHCTCPAHIQEVVNVLASASQMEDDSTTAKAFLQAVLDIGYVWHDISELGKEILALRSKPEAHVELEVLQNEHWHYIKTIHAALQYVTTHHYFPSVEERRQFAETPSQPRGSTVRERRASRLNALRTLYIPDQQGGVVAPGAAPQVLVVDPAMALPAGAAAAVQLQQPQPVNGLHMPMQQPPQLAGGLRLQMQQPSVAGLQVAGPGHMVASSGLPAAAVFYPPGPHAGQPGAMASGPLLLQHPGGLVPHPMMPGLATSATSSSSTMPVVLLPGAVQQGPQPDSSATAIIKREEEVGQPLKRPREPSAGPWDPRLRSDDYAWPPPPDEPYPEDAPPPKVPRP